MGILPHTPSRAAVTVRRVAPSECESAGRVLRGWLDRVWRTGADPGLLYGAFDAGGRLVTAVWLVPQAGKTGLLFLSPAGDREVEAMAAALRLACADAPRDRVRFAQALPEPREAQERGALRAAGFERVTQLAYMHGSVECVSPEPTLPEGVRLVGYSPGTHDRFLAALEATYPGSLDCPAMRPLRETRDVMAGHRAVGEFNPGGWSLAEVEGEDAGLVLLNRVPAMRCVELVYVGVVPLQRGRGLGGSLLRHALWRVARSGESLVTLAVDVGNAPALALYASLGFTRTGVRDVWVKPVGD